LLSEAKFDRYLVDNNGCNVIKGVICIQGDETEAKTISIESDLVVDCMGITSPTPSLLKQQLGVDVERTIISTHLQYVSQLYKNAEGTDSPLLYYQPAPPNTLTGTIVLPFAKGVTNLTMVAYNKAPLPREQKDVSPHPQQSAINFFHIMYLIFHLLFYIFQAYLD
jgi:hypothetical protein